MSGADPSHSADAVGLILAHRRTTSPGCRDSWRAWAHAVRGGACAPLLLLAPFTAATATLAEVPYLGTVVGVAVLYLALGHRSLHDHARPVAAALSAGDEAEARRLVGLIVSRDPASLDITRAATESVLENGNDAVFGALFWFVVAGAPGVVVYRLANTLDAMWGSYNSIGETNDEFAHKLSVRCQNDEHRPPRHVSPVANALAQKVMSFLNRLWLSPTGC